MTNNAPPDWLLLMQQWLEQKMGNTGITLPFLAGALALKQGKNHVSVDGLSALINAMVSNPVKEHFVGVRKCAQIQAPVLSSLPFDAPLIRKCEARSPSGQISFAFSPDAMSALGGLDCNCASGCIEKLIQYSLPFTESGNFSRVYDKKSCGFVYSTFRENEIKFIRSVLCC